jgi:sugar phosphate isomerase/epimerase
MKVAVSNIAWSRAEEPHVASLLVKSGFRGVEIAPTKVWDQPLEVTEGQAREHRRFWNEHGIDVVAMQALLFGRPELTLFETPKARSATLEYLRGLMRLGEWLGVLVLVFGAPKNRRAGEAGPAVAERIAVDFFGAAGAHALEHGVVLAIEPNPPQYDCDFVTTSREGLDLVRKVRSGGFGLHLDAAAMTLAGEPLPDAVLDCAGSIAHFHVSEPFLGVVGEGTVGHRSLASALRRIGYSNWASIEMRADPECSLPKVLTYVAETYGG